MRTITPSFSHINLQRKNTKQLDKDWSKPLQLDEVLRSDPKRVNTYEYQTQDKINEICDALRD